MMYESAPMEIERKFLIRRPTQEMLEGLECFSRTHITQTYLVRKSAGTERRIRRRGSSREGYTFFYTEKTDITNGERIERERRISHSEYERFLTEADTSLNQIVKTRYCFFYESRCFELDIYPFSEEYAILEIELDHIEEEVVLPELDIIREVTEDKMYRNYMLARTLSLEAPAGI